MVIGGLFLAVAAVLPPVVSLPGEAAGRWEVVEWGRAPEAPAAGYLVVLPPLGASIGADDLVRLVEMGAGGAVVVGVAATPPPELLPYLDGFLPEPRPDRGSLAGLIHSLAGVPLVLRAADLAEAVDVLAAGATAVILAEPLAELERELTGLLPDRDGAGWSGGALPTALRDCDLATVVGIPGEFPGAGVVLSGHWYDRAMVISAGGRYLVEPVRVPGGTVYEVPAVGAAGALLVVSRPVDPPRERVGVVGERPWRTEEVLARHHRSAIRQSRLLPRWRAHQQLLVRVWIGELSRSLEVLLGGAVHVEHGLGADWEVSEAWVEGVAWPPAELPELPLLEPRRPPVPPLAVQLETGFTYGLQGRDSLLGRDAFVVSFEGRGPEGERRGGRAWLDAETFGLMALEEVAEHLPGEVRSSRSLTQLRPFRLGSEIAWLPVAVAADDLVAAFGRTVTVRREARLTGHDLEADGFDASLGAAHASALPMFRETEAGVVPLVPDGLGGRTPGGPARGRQRMLLAGVLVDPGFGAPIPMGGLQVHDFNFRGRGEHLRLLLAGVVNDGAWSAPRGAMEVTARGFVQALPLTSSAYRDGREQREEELGIRRQRFGGGLAGSRGSFRLALDLGLEHWDFSATGRTGAAFIVPRDTWEGVGRLHLDTIVAGITVSLTGETGHRIRWHPWGWERSEEGGQTWRRARVMVTREYAPVPLVRTRWEGEFWVGTGLDRFSAPAPARFGDVRVRGIAAGRVIPDALLVLRGGLAFPLGPRRRVELGADLGWVRDRRAGYHARPLAGVGLGVTARGPWGSLLQCSLEYPITTPGHRGLMAQLMVLRPLVSSVVGSRGRSSTPEPSGR